MDIFNLKDFDEIQSKAKVKTYQFSIKIISLLIIYFIVKFNIIYSYQRFNPLMIGLLISLLISYPLMKKITGNTFLALLSYTINFNLVACLLIYLTGGFKSPGAMWFAFFPFLSASFLGRRGFISGFFLLVLIFITYFILAANNIVFYPYDSIVPYHRELQTNLFIFCLFSIYMTFGHVKSENAYLEKIKKEKDKNENLLRILFHDLANPLQSIKLLLRKVMKNRNPEENEKTILKVDQMTNRMVELLEHVKKMKALEDGMVLIELKPITINESVEKMIQIIETRLIEKEIEIVVKNSKEDLTMVTVDHVYFINQVLANIISNSIKFSNPKGKIYISWEKLGDKIRIIITDEGIGIPAKILSHLFTDKKEHSRQGTYGEVGTGYGMSLVKTFIEEFKGTIEVTSVEKTTHSINHGTTTILTLPAV